MGDDIRLGRIAGVPVGASWSLLVILALLAWTLGAGVLPAAAPGAHAAIYWPVAVVTAVAFLACLLAHELAHALVARRRDVEVEGITLWMFGGMSRLRGDAHDARTERRVALAGPVASVVLGVGFTAVALLLDAVRAPEVAVTATSWLGFVNVMLAVFNLLPAYPLDGGRVLRAVVWDRTGDLRRATMLAASYGRRIGSALIALGVLLVLAGRAASGIWLALLGWIIVNAAGAEAAGFELRRLLHDVLVADVMTADPVTAPADLTVEELIRHYVVPYRCSAFPVTGGGGSPVGLVTLSRIRDVPAEARATTSLAEVAVPLDQVVTARPGDQLLDLLARFTPASGRRALVLEDGRLVGIVTARDIDRMLEVAGVEVTEPGSLVRTR
jgi:Zn-dependent protease